MWKKKLAIALSESFCESRTEQLKLIKAAGFDGVFSGWSPEEAETVAKEIRGSGLAYQSIHAPIGHAAHLWEEDKEKAEAGVREQIACLEDCSRYGVPIMVTHTYIGFEGHTPNQLGIERFGEIVRAAERLGVQVALENTEGEEYLAALLEAFRGNPAVGFCWDSGHEMCYNHSQDLVTKWKDRLIATHLNDNLGISDWNGALSVNDDLHLLPFDGIADWEYNAARLRETGFDGFLTFEVLRHSKPGRHDNDFYQSMPLEQYLARAYKSACRFASLLEPTLRKSPAN